MPKPEKRINKAGRAYYVSARGRRISKKAYFRSLRRSKKVRRGARRVRPVRDLVGWRSRAAWDSWLEGRYPGIELYDPPPGFLQNVFPVERSYFLSRDKKYPPAEGSYILLAIYYVVYHLQEETFFLWSRTVALAPSLREDMLYRKAEELYEDIEQSLGERFSYIEVRDWVGFAADTEKKFGRGKRRHHGKKRHRRKAASSVRHHGQSPGIPHKKALSNLRRRHGNRERRTGHGADRKQRRRHLRPGKQK